MTDFDTGSHLFGFYIAGSKGAAPELLSDTPIEKAQAIELLRSRRASGSLTADEVQLIAYRDDDAPPERAGNVSTRPPTMREIGKRALEIAGFDTSKLEEPEPPDPNSLGAKLASFFGKRGAVDVSDATPLGRRLARGLASGLFDS